MVMDVTALASSQLAATRVVDVTTAYRSNVSGPKPVLAVWVGEDRTAAATFDAANIPHYSTEADAVAGFMQAVRYREAYDSLMETPPSLPDDFAPDTETARRIVNGAMASGRVWLNPVEVTGLLDAYQIPIVPAVLARDADEAVAVPRRYSPKGAPVVVKYSVAGHRAQVGGRRRQTKPRQCGRDPRSNARYPCTSARCEARRAHRWCHNSSNDPAFESA